MKYILLLLLFITATTISNGQDNNCFQKFRTGKFTYEGKEGEIEIIRTRNSQTEIYNNGRSKLILNLEWVNDSTYILTQKKAINAPGCLDKNDWIKATIIKCSGTSYTCQYTSNKCGEGQATFVKLK